MNELIPLASVLVIAIGSLAFLLAPTIFQSNRFGVAYSAFLIAAAMGTLVFASGGNVGLSRGILVDSYSWLLALTACGAALVSLVATSESLVAEKIDYFAEYYFLMLMTLCGALVMILAVDLLTLFIGLEILSIALYCVCGARITKPQSAESSLKYFLLGCFSSSFLLYGIALWYGATGSLSIYSASVTALDSSPLLMVSFLFILVGLGFKAGLAPFHLWIPDVYQGAPTSVTTFMSCVVKVAAFAALFKVAVVSFLLPSEWATGVMWVVSVLAMTMGNLAALRQRSVKRMLAYSSVAQAGYVAMGLVAAANPDALAASLYYLVVYCSMTIGCFAVLSVLGPDVDDIDDLRGLGARSPFLAACMTLFFLALAGLPPSLAGLMGKLYIFSASLSAGMIGLAAIAAINSAIACAYYLRIPIVMLFKEGDTREPVSVPLAASASIAGCAAAVVVLGLLPEGVLSAAVEGVRVLITR